MFDLTAGTADRPFRDKHASATAVSIVTHAVILGSIVWVMLFSISDTLPDVPSMMAFVAEAPPPTVLHHHHRRRPRPSSRPSRQDQLRQPGQHSLRLLRSLSGSYQTALDLGDEGGVVGGVEGGIPGGVLGGVLGGMVTEVLPPPSPPAPPKPRRVGGDLQAPALIHRVEPDYPGVAVSGKVSGTVILEATVNEAGLVTDVKVLRSIILLDKAAIKAVQQWRYQPLILNGEPVPFILTVTVTFSLR